MLKIKNLTMSYKTRKGYVRALRNIDFELNDGDIVGLVGESGCGKSTLLLAIMKLIPSSALIEGGEILYEGRIFCEVAAGVERDQRKRHRYDFSGSHDDAESGLRVGDQISESLRVHHIAAAIKNFSRQKKPGKRLKRNWHSI